MYSLRGAFADGQLWQLGGELIDTGHSSIRGLAAELRIALADLCAVDAGYDADVLWVGGARRSTTGVTGALAPVAARLYFAGEHCSLPAQGFMEGGCETGESAARVILASLRAAAREERRGAAIAELAIS
jgi:hypothetical protein